ncbi:hypothetical protein RCL1_003161 [Eukaryota sp. TZLM3-RCL]
MVLIVKKTVQKSLFKFLHLPLQSGSDTVLEAMKRDHESKDWIESAIALKELGVTLSTDIIVGFPGEADEHHAETFNVLKVVLPPFMNVTNFFPRPGTPAFKMPRVYHGTVKNRSWVLHNWMMTCSPLPHLLGSRVVCFVYGPAHDGVSTAAHTIDYFQVLVSETFPAGTILNVENVEVTR